MREPDTYGFQECAVCAAKPGSPALCVSCYQNQTVIHQLARKGIGLSALVDKLRARIDRLLDSDLVLR